MEGYRALELQRHTAATLKMWWFLVGLPLGFGIEAETVVRKSQTHRYTNTVILSFTIQLPTQITRNDCIVVENDHTQELWRNEKFIETNTREDERVWRRTCQNWPLKKSYVCLCGKRYKEREFFSQFFFIAKKVKL